jgi:hypothetical protein
MPFASTLLVFFLERPFFFGSATVSPHLTQTILLLAHRLSFQTTYRPPGSLAGPGIGFGSLTAHRKATSVAQTTIRSDVNQAFDIHRNLTSQVSLNVIIAFDRLPKFGDIFVGQGMYPSIRIDAGFLQYLRGRSGTNTKNITQANFDPFVLRQVNSSYSCQLCLLSC